jgi:S1-C subfamily serine protease
MIPVNERDVIDAVQKVSPAVVSVGTLRIIQQNFYRTIPVRGMGSGIIFDSNGGILKNHHIVEDAERVEVATVDGKRFKGEVLGSDATTDVAVVQVDGEDLPKVQLGDSDKLVVGQIAIAIGNPYGFLLPGGPTVTVGVVSALKRHMHVEDHMYEDLIQTDASINPGNSGGPLVNASGDVIGVNTANIPFAQGIGFAIPINAARKIAKEIIAHGRVIRPYMGISGTTLSREIAQYYDIPYQEGALILKVSGRGPAGLAGLAAGDVITGVDGQTLKEWEELQHVVQNKKVGDLLRVRIKRRGEEVTIDVRMAEAPSADSQFEYATQPFSNR